VLHKSHLLRLVERYPTIRSQIMAMADNRYRVTKDREVKKPATSTLRQHRASLVNVAVLGLCHPRINYQFYQLNSKFCYIFCSPVINAVNYPISFSC